MYGQYTHANPARFAANPARARDHRSMDVMLKSGGYLGPDPTDPLKAIFEGFFFLAGE
jgi:hypothetical protein